MTQHMKFRAKILWLKISII